MVAIGLGMMGDSWDYVKRNELHTDLEKAWPHVRRQRPKNRGRTGKVNPGASRKGAGDWIERKDCHSMVHNNSVDS